MVASLALVAALALPAAGREVVVRAGGAAALGPPQVRFELRNPNGRALAARDDDGLGDLLAGLVPAAVLDTGASGTVLSGLTTARYDVAPERGARYVEVGLTGEHAMGVSRPYTLAVCAPGEQARCRPSLLLRSQRLLLNEPTGDLLSLIAAPGRATDVIGMPAIREMVVELRSGGQALAPPAVALHPAGANVAAAHWLDLDMVDFNRRRHPRNRGPLPSVTVNPLVPDVRVRVGTRAARGDWLLDTGAVVTVLSSRLANDVGLVDGRGRPRRPADFTLPIGGISGAQRSLPGFHLDRLEVDAEDGTTIVVAHPSVLVHDVVTTTDDGREHRLDGILGMNVLAAAFERVVIDGPRARLGLTPAR